MTTTAEEREWLREQLHSPAMHCRQCEITRRLLDQVEESQSDAIKALTEIDADI